ncbi:MAG TPA: hypothetical protein VF043_11210 [Ktedonobacteraceae bacterium]
METVVYVLIGVVVFVSLLLLIWFSSSADRRARRLLHAVLTHEQYHQLMRWGYIDIPSPSDPQRTYRVPQVPGHVHVIQNHRLTAGLCLQPLERIPEADYVVIHKLMIEADEETYLQKANRIEPIMFQG